MKRISSKGERRRHQLPIADVTGNEDRPVSFVLRLIEILFPFDGNKRFDLILLQVFEFEDFDQSLPQILEALLQDLLKLPLRFVGAEGDPQAFQRPCPLSAKEIIKEGADEAAQSNSPFPGKGPGQERHRSQ